MEHVFFKPWIDKNYEMGGIFGRKIPVFSGSHYYDGCEQWYYGKIHTIINY